MITDPDALSGDRASMVAMLRLLRDVRAVSPAERADAVRDLLDCFPALRQADLAALLGLSRQLLAPVLDELLQSGDITVQRIAGGERHRPAQWYTRADASPPSPDDLPHITAAVARLLAALDMDEADEADAAAQISVPPTPTPRTVAHDRVPTPAPAERPWTAPAPYVSALRGCEASPTPTYPAHPAAAPPRPLAASALAPRPPAAPAPRIGWAHIGTAERGLPLRWIIGAIVLLVLVGASMVFSLGARVHIPATADAILPTALVLPVTEPPAPTATPQPHAAIITADGVRLRAAPLDGAVRATLRRGTVVAITGEPASVASTEDPIWWPVRAGTAEGWVSSRFLAPVPETEGGP